MSYVDARTSRPRLFSAQAVELPRVVVNLFLLIRCGCNSHTLNMYKHTPHTYPVVFSRFFARLPYPKHTPSTCNPCVSYVDARTRAHTAMLT